MGSLVAFINVTFVIPLISYLHGIIYYREKKQNDEAEDHLWPYSAAMFPVPYMSDSMSKMIKEKLPAMSLGEFQWRREGISEVIWCAICLNWIEESEEIRLVGNCSHLFHRKCIDGWVEHQHATCPLCRLKLLPVEKEKGKVDPWREERIVYLFGEDYVNFTF